MFHILAQVLTIESNAFADGQVEEDITMGSSSTRRQSTIFLCWKKKLLDVFGLAITDTIMFMFFSRWSEWSK